MSFFGKNIKKIRGVKGMSQQVFAELFELKRPTLGAYEEGRSEPKIETLIKIANYFSISIDALLTEELTVNDLLKFKGDLTTDTHQITKDVFPEISCVTEKMTGDYPFNFEDPNFIQRLPKIQLPIPEAEHCRAFEVQNLEMTQHDKGFYPKDIVVG
ncbi:MAG: helix-turn-helix transcriptional regulator, partial [Bacteroidota bacterium]